MVFWSHSCEDLYRELYLGVKNRWDFWHDDSQLTDTKLAFVSIVEAQIFRQVMFVFLSILWYDEE